MRHSISNLFFSCLNSTPVQAIVKCYVEDESSQRLFECKDFIDSPVCVEHLPKITFQVCALSKDISTSLEVTDSTIYGYSVQVNDVGAGTIFHPSSFGRNEEDVEQVCVNRTVARGINTCAEPTLSVPVITADMVQYRAKDFLAGVPGTFYKKARICYDKNTIYLHDFKDSEAYITTLDSGVLQKSFQAVRYLTDLKEIELPGKSIDFTGLVARNSKSCSIDIGSFVFGLGAAVLSFFSGPASLVGALLLFNDAKDSYYSSVACEAGNGYAQKLDYLEDIIYGLYKMEEAKTNAAKLFVLTDDPNSSADIETLHLFEIERLTTLLDVLSLDLLGSKVLSAETIGQVALLNLSYSQMRMKKAGVNPYHPNCKALVNIHDSIITQALNSLNMAEKELRDHFDRYKKEDRCASYRKVPDSGSTCTFWDETVLTKKTHIARVSLRDFEDGNIIDKEKVWCEDDVCVKEDTTVCCEGSPPVVYCYPCGKCLEWSCNPVSINNEIPHLSNEARNEWSKKVDKWWNGDDKAEGVRGYFDTLQELSNLKEDNVRLFCGYGTDDYVSSEVHNYLNILLITTIYGELTTVTFLPNSMYKVHSVMVDKLAMVFAKMVLAVVDMAGVAGMMLGATIRQILT